MAGKMFVLQIVSIAPLLKKVHRGGYESAEVLLCSFLKEIFYIEYINLQTSIQFHEWCVIKTLLIMLPLFPYK